MIWPSTHYTIDDMCHPHITRMPIDDIHHITIIKQINKLLQLMTCAIHTLPESTKSTSCYNWWHVPSTHYQNQPNQQAVTIDDMCHPHITRINQINKLLQLMTCAIHTLPESTKSTSCYNWWHVPSLPESSRISRIKELLVPCALITLPECFWRHITTFFVHAHRLKTSRNSRIHINPLAPSIQAPHLNSQHQ